MNVFVLTNGSYSDYRIVAVFTTLANAEMARGHFPDDAGIEEYELDAAVDFMRNDHRLYFVRLHRETGETLECNRHDSSYGAFSSAVVEDVNKNLYTNCWATDDRHAVKIAADRRRAFLALPVSVGAVDPQGERVTE